MMHSDPDLCGFCVLSYFKHGANVPGIVRPCPDYLRLLATVCVYKFEYHVLYLASLLEDLLPGLLRNHLVQQRMLLLIRSLWMSAV